MSGEKGDKKIYLYRNLRIFEKNSHNWKLRLWYNYEIDDAESIRPRTYDTTYLDTFSDLGITGTNEKEKQNRQDLLKFLYTEVGSSWKQLVEVRFKLLTLLPPLSILGLVAVFKINDNSPNFKVFVCILGFLGVLAVYIYDKRNSQLHDDLIIRGRKIESELGFINARFLGSPESDKYLFGIKKFIKIQHRDALNIIYLSSLIAWLIALIRYFVPVAKSIFHFLF